MEGVRRRIDVEAISAWRLTARSGLSGYRKIEGDACSPDHEGGNGSSYLQGRPNFRRHFELSYNRAGACMEGTVLKFLMIIVEVAGAGWGPQNRACRCRVGVWTGWVEISWRKTTTVPPPRSMLRLAGMMRLLENSATAALLAIEDSGEGTGTHGLLSDLMLMHRWQAALLSGLP